MLVATLGTALPMRTATAAPPPGGGTVIVDETFDGASVPDPAWRVDGVTCLTGTPAGSTPPAGGAQIPSCQGHTSGPVPPVGVTPGYLQLTDTAGNVAGDILYQRPVPATAGLSVVFEQYQYGGNEADGIGFFLVDGATTASTVGGSGGSLGYAPRDATPGVQGGYLGVGLDVYGNFYNDGEGRGRNCPVGQRSPGGTATGRIAPNVVTLRGPGNGFNGYCYLASTTTGDGAHPTSTLTGSLRGPAGTTTPPPAKRLVNVQVTPAPAPRVIVQIDFTGTGGSYEEVLNVPAPGGTPSTYKFGFLGSTGGNNDVHLLRNVVVRTINALDALQLVKQVSRAGTPLPATITAGTAIPYEYVVTNAGLETLTGLTVSDNKVGGITCDATTLPPEPDPGGTTVCRGSYTVTAADVAAGVVTNVATATAQSPGGPVDSNQDQVELPLVSSLSITKSVQTAPPFSVGQTITYRYVVTNTGGSRISQVAVTDNRVAAGAVICGAGALIPGAQTICTGPYTIAAGAIAADGTLTNVATAGGVSPIGQAVRSAPATAVIPLNADIAVTKTVSDATPTVGDSVTFTVTVKNNGPSLGAGVVISDKVPPGLTLLSSDPSVGSYDAATGRWTLPTLAVNGSATLRLTVRVDTAAAVTNGASVIAAGQPDPNPGNNTASAGLNPVTPTVDIAVTKSVDQPSIRVGHQAVFTITASNKGPFGATTVTLLDPIPSLLAYVSSSATKGSYDPGSAQWTIGGLAVGQSVSLTLTVRALGVGTVSNTASLAAVSPADINQLNDQDTATVLITPPLADLAVAKTVAPDPVIVGQEVTYQVTAYNIGPDPAPSVVVDEFGPVPTGLEIVSFSVTQGSFDGDALEWAVGRLDAGASPAVLTLVVKVLTPGTKVNTAVISDPAITDPDPSNNHSDATLVSNLPPLDIEVDKSVAPVRVRVTEQATFTVTAKNNGPNPATGLVLHDSLPDGLSHASFTGPGTYDPVSGEWTIGALASGATVTLTIVATADRAGTAVNVASLLSVDQTDTDASNNSASASLLVVEEADLSITKAVVPTVAAIGDIVTYTVVLTNNGPNTAGEIVAADPQRLFADFVEVTFSQGTFDQDQRVWSAGTLAPGAHATLVARIRVVNGGTTVNTVQITQSNLPDPDLINNQAQAVLMVPLADVSVAKAVDKELIPSGGQAVFTITVRNAGPETATGVTVADALPAGLTLVSAKPTTGGYATGTWTVGDLLPGATATLVLTVRGTTPGRHVNTAVATSTGPPDPDKGNNTATATVTVLTPGGELPPPTGGGQMPSTGMPTFVYGSIIGGGLLLAGGALLVVALRRRRGELPA
ncbi:putative repeat protein (TIGR01451 family) [Allocatelliglobosispora scoriae]|uniref:Putative repeat protein (TIGR01451 family) n=1 Tax=Allocatelliglobosispora scoriae TaxID=643052 RepID=A0A841BWK0_9ACTN|nr:DUF11 domain-containing protein [Allocatelliglobosispora scoriae]MBB5871858.1 putative repeat protein (TIGR01451 family) [Allocatelliglobosispora scoriae]